MVLLRNSYRAIEMLTFRGRKTDKAQPSAFPRWPSTDVPDQIKEAQIANAIVLADESSQDDVEYYDRLHHKPHSRNDDKGRYYGRYGHYKAHPSI